MTRARPPTRSRCYARPTSRPAGSGERLKTSGPTFEIYVAGAGGDRQLRVILSTTTGGAFGELKAALETLAVTPRPRGPEFEARLKTVGGAELGTATAQLDQPFTIGDEQRRGVGFEYDPGLVVVDAGVEVPAFMLRQRDITIQLMAPPFRMEPADLAAAGGLLTETTPFTRRVGATDYAGVRGAFAMGEITVETQILAFDRGGRSFVVLIQAPAASAAAATKLADAVIASAR